jgi:hypothetical protein
MLLLALVLLPLASAPFLHEFSVLPIRFRKRELERVAMMALDLF